MRPIRVPHTGACTATITRSLKMILNLHSQIQRNDQFIFKVILISPPILEKLELVIWCQLNYISWFSFLGHSGNGEAIQGRDGGYIRLIRSLTRHIQLNLCTLHSGSTETHFILDNRRHSLSKFRLNYWITNAQITYRYPLKDCYILFYCKNCKLIFKLARPNLKLGGGLPGYKTDKFVYIYLFRSLTALPDYMSLIDGSVRIRASVLMF